MLKNAVNEVINAEKLTCDEDNSDLREICKRPEPSYAELKESDGIRLLVRLLYHGMQE